MRCLAQTPTTVGLVCAGVDMCAQLLVARAHSPARRQLGNGMGAVAGEQMRRVASSCGIAMGISRVVARCGQLRVALPVYGELCGAVAFRVMLCEFILAWFTL